MRFRAQTGWAVMVLLAAVGCGQTTDAVDGGGGTSAGVGAGGGAEANAGTGGGGDDTERQFLDFVGSGSRVVALGYSSNEARVFRTFHDQRLNVDCSFVPSVSGGDERCAPTQRLQIVFTDAACTEPAAWVQRWWDKDEAAVGDLVSGRPSLASVDPTCPGAPPEHVDAYRVAERLAEEAIAVTPLGVYSLESGRCQGARLPGKVAPALHRLVPLPESELARGQRVSVRVSDGLRLTRLLADDGAHLNLGVTGADQTPCAFQRDGECVPEPIAHIDSVVREGWASPSLTSDCSVPAFWAPHPLSCGVAKFGVEDDGVSPLKVRALEPVTAYFGSSLVVPVTTPATYQCQALERDEYSQVAAPGRDLTGTLPVAAKLRRGAGPLHVDWFAIGERELLPSSGADFRNEAGQVCRIQPAEDGTLRCVVLDENTGEPTANLTTFPQVLAFTY